MQPVDNSVDLQIKHFKGVFMRDEINSTPISDQESSIGVVISANLQRSVRQPVDNISALTKGVLRNRSACSGLTRNDMWAHPMLPSATRRWEVKDYCIY